jgi:hypothetical protein
VIGLLLASLVAAGDPAPARPDPAAATTAARGDPRPAPPADDDEMLRQLELLEKLDLLENLELFE